MPTIKSYGWIYDKKGNRVPISAPERNGKPISKPRKTQTGRIPDSVGYHGVQGVTNKRS